MAMKNLITGLVLATSLSVAHAADDNTTLQADVDTKDDIHLSDYGAVISLGEPLTITRTHQTITGPGRIIGRVIISDTARYVRLQGFEIESNGGHGLVINGANGVWITDIALIFAGEHGSAEWCISADRQDSLFLSGVLCQHFDNGLRLMNGVNTWASGLVLDTLGNIGILIKPTPGGRRRYSQFTNTWIAHAKYGVFLDGRDAKIAGMQFLNTTGIRVGRMFTSVGAVLESAGVDG